MLDTNRLSCEEMLVIAEVESISNLLKAATRLTDMRFGAISHMTETYWTACAVHDELCFGITVGDALEIERTLCGELRINPRPIIVGDVRSDSKYFGHDIPKLYGIESFISLPIVFLDGSVFGSLCMLDYVPKKIDCPKMLDILKATVKLFSIALELRQKGSHIASSNDSVYLKGNGLD